MPVRNAASTPALHDARARPDDGFVRATFSDQGAVIELQPEEFGFVFRALNDRLSSLPEWEVKPRLGLDHDAARDLLDDLLAAESRARQEGQHWLPPRSGD